MPTVKISHVISFSSEDPSFPAENLIRNETYKKWKCKLPGEKQASVILQLEKASVISSIDIGNEFSAFVEVLVGRSGATSEEFQVLLVASSFMSPLEARNGTPVNRVRMFAKEHLSKPTVEEKWDQIKIVCTQPFNRNVQYGLSFITIHSPETQEENASRATLGRFTVEEDDEIIPVGSLFAKHKQTQEPPLKGAVAIRKASQLSSGILDDLKTVNVDKTMKLDNSDSNSAMGIVKGTHSKPEETENSKAEEIRQGQFHKDKKPTKAMDLEEKANTSKERNNVPSKKDYKLKRQSESTTTSPPLKKKPKPVVRNSRKVFEKLLEGVVFVLSGYQNPNRQMIRDKAIEMGAKYKPDWTSGCTHLICAFPNTPKFQQVKGKGCIVSQKWINECYCQRKRLPWRRYALDRSDQGKDESEEEIWEDISGQLSDVSENDIPNITNDGRGYHSGSDTDEDIKRVKLESLRELEAQKLIADNNSQKKDDEDPYDGETDVDSDAEDLKENRPTTSNTPLPHLPNFYEGKTFYLHSELGSDIKKQLSRYIIAFKGLACTDLASHVDYMLAEMGTDLKTIKMDHPSIVVVTPEWVWKCNDAEKLLPTTLYEID